MPNSSPSSLAAYRPHLAALSGGFAGAALAALAGLPAGPLIGASLAVALLAGWHVAVAVDERLRLLAFTTIGLSLGSTVPPGMLDQIGGWIVSLAILMLSLIATLWIGTVILSRVFGHDVETALMSTIPGTLSNVVALAIEGRGDVTTIMVLQTLRVLMLVVFVPPIATLAGPPESVGSTIGTMGTGDLAVLLVAGLMAARAFAALRIPAAALLAGMIVGAAAHLGGLVEGYVPYWAIFASFAVTGAALGARFSAIGLSRLMRLFGEAVVSVGIATLVSIGFAFLVTTITGLPAGQVWIAFAPGAVEAMAAIGLALGYDPAYVAVHHFARIAMLLALAPLALRLVGRAP